MLGLEISLVGFLLQDNYASGVEALAQTFLVSGIVVGVDILLKVIAVFMISLMSKSLEFRMHIVISA